ncbi:hypothetical protein V1509DRAFT_652353 [Lipomyces kononenkoae]
MFESFRFTRQQVWQPPYSAVSYVIPYFVAAICIGATGDICSSVAGEILAAVAVVVAAVVVANSNDRSTAKRSFEIVTQALGYQIAMADWQHDNNTLAPYYIPNSRACTGDLNFVLFGSNFGNHIAVSYKHSHVELATLIGSSNPGIMPALEKVKRSETFEVDWLSYNYDNVNDDLCRYWYNAEGGSYDTYLEIELGNFIQNNGDWKYCVAPNVLRQGEAADYNDIPGTGYGTGNAMHGEVYFNTYGGIDGYCYDYCDGGEDTWSLMLEISALSLCVATCGDAWG